MKRVPAKPLAYGGVGHNSSRIEEVAVRDLIIDPRDAWKQTAEDIDRAAPIVTRCSNDNTTLPIIVAGDDVVAIGQTFVLAAKQLGIERLLVVRQTFPNETERLLFSTACNKVLSTGFWDGALLSNLVLDFEKSIEDFSHDLIGFAPGALDKIIGANMPSEGADKLPVTKTLDPVSRVGQLWVAGPHRIICGNSTDPVALALLMNGQHAAAAIVDPPFGCRIEGVVAKKGKHREFVQGSGDMDDSELLDFFLRLCRGLASTLRPGALVYLFIDWRSLRLLLQAGQEVFGDLINLCVWTKDRGGMGSFYRSQHELVLVFRQPGAQHTNNIQLGKHGVNRTNVWAYPSAASSRKGREGDLLKSHPTPKIVEMIGDAMLDCTVRGEIVVDTFLGSGTALIAAERTGRICFGMDLDPLYVDLAIRRWQAWTGEKAVDAETGETFDHIAQRISQGSHDDERG